MLISDFVKQIYYLNKQAIINLINHDGVEHAGYMSFIILMSLFPFLIFFLSLSHVLGAYYIGQSFIQLLLDNVPNNLIIAIDKQIKELYYAPPEKAMNLAIFGIIWTSSSFIESIRTILNRIYQVSYPSYIWRRFLSIIQFFFITISIFCLMMIWITGTISLYAIPELAVLINKIPYYGNYAIVINYIAAGLILFMFVNIFYCMVPNTSVKLKTVLPGSLLTVVLWLSSADIMSKYISYYTQLNLVYGSVGSVVVVLMFFYVVSIVFIYGAELNFLIATKKLSKIK